MKGGINDSKLKLGPRALIFPLAMRWIFFCEDRIGGIHATFLREECVDDGWIGLD